MKRQQTVWVRNNGKEPFSDRYDGEDFTIAPGGAEEMLVEAAELCLGFGQDDKVRCVRRLGWAFTQENMKAALERLGQFSFHMTEKEAVEFRPSKQISSSAPADGETAAGSQDSAAGVGTLHLPPKSPLEKLATANARAG